MNLSEFKKHLAQHPSLTLRFALPTGTRIPPHAHVTEVARIDKRFVDCGGTFRTESTCRLQTWFADDTAHRLDAGKLLKILDKADSFLGSDDLTVEVEHEAPFISQFPIAAVEVQGESLLVRLDTRHTACLAEDKCLPAALQPSAIAFRPLPVLLPARCCG